MKCLIVRRGPVIATVRRILGSILDFDRALRSDSIRAHVYAATFLAAEGKSGAPYLSELLSRCRSINPNSDVLSDDQQRLLSRGATSMATVVRAVGYDYADAVHAGVLQWIISLTTSRHIQIAGTSIHALATLGFPPQETRTTLEHLIRSDRRSDDYPLITCRGTAFRCLAEINRQFVDPFLDTPACHDHVTLLKCWLEHVPDDANLIEQLNWLTCK